MTSRLSKEVPRIHIRISRYFRKKFNIRNIRGFFARYFLGLFPPVARRCYIASETVAFDVVSSKLLFDLSDEVRVELTPDLLEHLSEYKGTLGRILDGNSLVLRARVSVCCLENCHLVSRTGHTYHLPTRRVVARQKLALPLRGSVPVFGAEVIPVAGAVASLLSTPRGNAHYFHFLQDIASLLIALDEMRGDETVTLLVRESLATFQESILVAVTREYPFLKITRIPEGAVIAPEILIKIYLNTSHPLEEFTFMEGWFKLKKLLIDHYGAENKGGEVRIYLSRGGQKTRAIANEDELAVVFSDRNIVTLRPEELDHAEQVALHRAAELVVSTCGAALTNILFCRPGTQVVEICPVDDHFPLFVGFALRLGLEYHFVAGGSMGYRDHFPVDSAKLQRTLDGLQLTPTG